MLRKKFETWLANPFPNITLIIVGMHITNLGYLEDKSLCFMELPNNGMEKSYRMLVGLDTAAIIQETNNQNLPDLIDLEAKWTNKKKEKAERCR